MIVKYTIDYGISISNCEAKGEKAEALLAVAEANLGQDPEQLLAETGVCEFSSFGKKFSIKVIDRG